MTSRISSEINAFHGACKKPREPARNLEGLKGFEFLEAVSSLDSVQLQALDQLKVCYIFNTLELSFREKSPSCKSLEVAFRVLMACKNHFDVHANFCKTLVLFNGDKSAEAALAKFSDRLFLAGNPLFKLFNALSPATYGKVYEAISSKNDVYVLELLQGPLSFHEKQHESFVLFDFACSHLGYEALSAFLQKNPHITSNAYRDILHNARLSSQQKLDLFIQLSFKGIDPCVKNDAGKSVIDYAIELKDFTALSFFLGQVKNPSDFNDLLHKAIQAEFSEAIKMLARLTTVKKEHIDEALALNRMDFVLMLVKISRFKWDCDNKTERLSPPALSSICIEEADLILNESSRDAYACVDKYPELYSMENFTLLRKELKNHYIQLAKSVAHAWGLETLNPIDPVSGKAIESDGSYPLRVLLHWIAFLNKQKDLAFVPELVHELKQVYHEDSDEIDFDEMRSRLKQDELIVCTTGYLFHTTYALFQNDIVFYANRGADAIRCGGSTYLAQDNHLAALIKRVVKDQTKSRDEYFSEKKLVEEAKLEYVQTTKHARQSGGFCTAASLKTAILGIMNFKSIDPARQNSITAWKEAAIKNKVDYKILTTRYRLYILNGLLFEIDHMLLNEADKAAVAPFYYHLLLSVKQKIETSKRFSPEQKHTLSNLTSLYLNELVAVMD